MTPTRALALIASTALGLAAPREASAGVTIDLLFVGRDGIPIAATDTVLAETGDFLTMAVLMRNDQRLSYAAFSLLYDLAGEELDVVAVFQWSGVPIGPPPILPLFSPAVVLPPSTETLVGPFSGSAPLGSSLPIAAGVFAGGYQMGTVVWKVTDAQTDGADVLSGLFDCGVCAFVDADFNVLPNILFHAATVNVPEPDTALLLGLALAGLALVLRRRR